MFCPLHSFIEMFSIMITLSVKRELVPLLFFGFMACVPLDH